MSNVGHMDRERGFRMGEARLAVLDTAVSWVWDASVSVTLAAGDR